MLRNALSALTTVVIVAVGSTAFAQLNVQWVSFQNDTATRLPGSLSTTISSNTTEADLDAGDLDLDGWLDVVVVRKQPSSLPGAKQNLVLLNNINGNGAFLDVTSTKANTSTYVGSNGMLDSTDDRDVDVADLNNDGYLDWLTTVTLSDGKAKYLSHPRVYLNQGFNPDTSWKGAKYIETAIPQLMSNAGNAAAPRFCEADLADIDEDGDLDAFFTDYDGTETGINEATGDDFDDRLLLNDGAGNFTDTVNTHMTTQQRFASFGVSCVLADVNGDGHVDLLKDTTLNTPIKVRVLYNDPAKIGYYDTFNGAAQTYQEIGSSQPYGIYVDDLNQDGKPDVMMADDGNDRYRLNQGNDAFSKVIWSPLTSYQWADANNNWHDDSFGNDNYAFDLDGDGWKDVLITDFDKDLPGCDRYMHIYHSTTPHTVGGTISLKHEVELSGTTNGWKGVVGLSTNDLIGTFDVCVRDFDNDGDLDLFIARCGSAAFWTNTKFSYVCQTDMGFGNGGGTLTSCGGDLSTGHISQMELTGAPAGGIAHMFGGFTWTPTVIPGTNGGQLGPFNFAVYVPLPVNAGGGFNFTIPGGGVPSATSIYVQMITAPISGANPRMTNGVRLDFAP